MKYILDVVVLPHTILGQPLSSSFIINQVPFYGPCHNKKYKTLTSASLSQREVKDMNSEQCKIYYIGHKKSRKRL